MEDKDQKMDIATFRFGVIADFVTGVQLTYGEREKLIQKKISRKYQIPHSPRTSITRSTIKKWVADYKKAGKRIEGLFPQKRKDAGKFRSLDASVQMAIKDIKRERPELTGINIINELKHRRVIALDEQLQLSVLYRFILKEGLNEIKGGNRDLRSFEATFPNEMWQSDVLHGPKIKLGSRKIKSYLIAVLDDHSRLIVHAEFYISEGLENFKNCLKKAIEKRGLPQKLYIDNGACFKALNLEQIAACLGIAIKHTPPYTPEGRGKVERWFRTIRDNFLNALPESLNLQEINERLEDWIENYHSKIHSTTKQTPLSRFQAGLSCVRPAPKNLLDYFRYCEFRRVKKDRTFRLNGVIFEGPVALIDKQVEIRFHRESPELVEVFFQGISYGPATILNRHVNFKIGRNNRITLDKKYKEPVNGELF